MRTVTRVDAASLRVGSVSGPSTVLGLDRALESGSGTGADMRTFAIHEVTSGRLDIHAPPRDRALSSGNDLYFEGPAAAAASLAGRRIMLVPPGAEAATAVVAAVAVDESGVPGLEGLHKVTLAAPVAYAGFPQTPDDTATVVFGNVVDADQGKTEPEAAIGSGDGRSTFQTFKLPKAPLTYHQAPSPDAAAGAGARGDRRGPHVDARGVPVRAGAGRRGLRRPRGRRRQLVGAVRRRRRVRRAAAERRRQRTCDRAHRARARTAR